MKLCEVLKNVNIVKSSADFDLEITGISYDTRTISSGDIFVAIKGSEFDGHDYIEDAVKKGAACIICEDYSGNTTDYIVVEDSRKALALISSTWFSDPSEELTLIGVTGTNGKTTVTTIIKHILECCEGGKVGLIGTNGIFIGSKEYPTSFTTPESYEIHKILREMVNEGCKYVVMEVSSHALSLDRVYDITFEVGVFTNLSPEHLDFHKTMDEYANAKSALFKTSRKSAINVDDKYSSIMIENTIGSLFRYSTKEQGADLIGKSIQLRSNRVDFCALTIGNLYRVELNIPGMFSVYNALAAISAALLLGFELDKIIDAVETSKSAKGRVEVVPINADFTVLIDYAHTPDALQNVISMAQESARGRVVTLFGCGGDRDSSKRPEMGKIAAQFSDFVVVTTDNPRTEEPEKIISHILSGMANTETPYKVIVNRRDAINWALENSQPDDVLILAGKGHETYQIVGKLKNHFDEREIIREYFEINGMNK